MIDPINSLAFSIQANRGVYAVMLGSGVSRSAKIPTGWEVTLDLVRKLAGISEAMQALKHADIETSIDTNVQEVPPADGNV